MPEQIRCPSCEAALRVPESLLGKNVKCPKCQTTFLAEMEESAPPEAIVREPPPSSVRRRPRLSEEQEYEEEEPPPEYEEEEEERPRRRRRGRRRSAQAEAAVYGPAISLIILGSLDIVLQIGYMVMSLAGFTFAAANARGAGALGANQFMQNRAFAIPGHTVGLCFAVAILMGGIKMKQLQNYGLAMTASILAILPCGNCGCCIGIFLGIWSLVVLNRPEVKDAFS